MRSPVGKPRKLVALGLSSLLLALPVFATPPLPSRPPLPTTPPLYQRSLFDPPPGLTTPVRRSSPNKSADLSTPFDAAQEFPNLFLPEQYRGLTPDEIPAQMISDSHRLVEQALASIFNRMVIPLVHPGETALRLTRYFPYLQKELAQRDPSVKLYANGGVVRSSISYLYDEVLKELRKNPDKTSEEVLNDIAHSKHDIPAGDIRGVGSDFDLLIDSPAGKGDELRKLAGELTNSAASAFGSTLNSGSMKNSLFTMGDIRDYDTQILRSTRQGGSTIDYLAFDIANQSLKNPSRFPEVSRDLILGRYEFAAPETAESIEDQADTIIRGYRTLLETPWLQLKDESVLRAGIQKLKAELAQGKSVSKRALGQFAKGLRNSRYFGAHNRFYRAVPGSIEAELLEYTRALGAKSSKVLLPEFADALPIDQRSGDRAELNGLPADLLENPKEFLKTNTRDGKIFHGTPSIENALAILRQGLFLSKSDQGTAAYGRGVYTSPDYSTARSYAGSQGLVFELAIKDDPKINILDWSKVSAHPAIGKITEKAKKRGRNIFEHLSREHGIDIIKNTHVLIQNAEAIQFPKGLSAVISPLSTRFKSTTSFSEADRAAYVEFKRLEEYTHNLGEASLFTPDERRRIDRLFLKDAFQDSRSQVRAVAVSMIRSLPPTEQTPILKTVIHDSDSEVRLIAYQSDWSGLSLTEKLEFIKTGIHDSIPIEAAAAGQFLRLPLERREEIVAALNPKSFKKRLPIALLNAHYQNGQGNPAELSEWISHGLSSSEWFIRRDAALLIKRLPSAQHPALLPKILADTDDDVRLAGLQSIDWSTLSSADRNSALKSAVNYGKAATQRFASDRFQLLSEKAQDEFILSISDGKKVSEETARFINLYYSENKNPGTELQSWISKALTHSEESIRRDAALLIKKLPTAQHQAFLSKILADTDDDVRLAGLQSIDWSTLSSADRNSALKSAVNYGKAATQRFASDRFQLLSEKAQAEFILSISDGKKVSEETARFINLYYSENKNPGTELQSWISKALTHSEESIRRDAALLIKKNPIQSQPALLLQALTDNDSDVRRAAFEATAIDRIEPEMQAKLISMAAQDNDSKLSQLAATSFERLTAPSQELVLKNWLTALETRKTKTFPTQLFLPQVWDTSSSKSQAVTSMDWDSTTHRELLKHALMNSQESILDPAVDLLVKAAEAKIGGAITAAREFANNAQIPGSIRKKLTLKLPALDLKYQNACAIWVRKKLSSLLGR